jgi:hypothetical protein
MAIRLHEAGFEHAKELIKGGLEVERRTCDWQKHKPTQDEVAKFLETHYLQEYGLWFLGIDTDAPENDKNRYIFPYGDLKIVHKDALIKAEEEAARQGHEEIQQAAIKLIEMIGFDPHPCL